MPGRLSKWLVVITLAFSLGIHWAFLQSLAWAGMIISYSQEASISDAVTKTFDGKHPCCLCKLVQRGKASEKKQETVKAEKQLDKFFPVGQSVAIFPPELPPVDLHALHPPAVRAETPPTPPPRKHA